MACAGGCHARGVRRDRGRRLHPADRLSRPHGPLRRHDARQERADLGLRLEALNHATRDLPPERMRLHLCWGNYEGPHHLDVPLGEIVARRLDRATRRPLLRGRQPAPRPRVGAVRVGQAARRQGADPGRAGFDDQLHRASRPGRTAPDAVRASGRPRASHRRHRLWLRDVRRLTDGPPRHRLRQARGDGRGRAPRQPRDSW